MIDQAGATAALVMTPRWRRMVLGLTALIAVIEGGFVLLVSIAQSWLATPVAGPLTLGLLLGALATLAGCAIAWFYVAWANRIARQEAAR